MSQRSSAESGQAAFQAHKASIESELSELFLRFSTDQDKLRGFAGKWTFFKADSAEPEDISSQFRCLRTYDLIANEDASDDSVSTIKFQTFNESEPTNGRARKRSIDGIYESSHLRSSSDLFFSNRTNLSDAEKEEDVPDCVFWRSMALDRENVMRIAPTLPPRPHADELGMKYPNWTANNGQSGVFAFEAFLMHGEDRWSMGALYSLSDLSLISHFCIQERLTTVDSSKAMDFDKFDYRTPAGRLPSEPQSWLDADDYRGEMTEMIWDEDGEAMKLPPRPANYNPPNPHSSTHRLFLYDDACYAFYPLKLPEVQADGSKQFGEGARFELGVLHNTGAGSKKKAFRRLILRYSAAGAAVSLTKEHFKPEGSFEFDRRQSQSVRRSIGSRRAASSRTLDQNNMFARSEDYRTAKLREAFHRAESGGDVDVASTTARTSSPSRLQQAGGNILDKATLSRIMENKASRT